MQELFYSLSHIGHKSCHGIGTILFFEGEKAHKLFVLMKGKVRLYKNKNDIDDTTQYTLHIASAPCFIAEMPFFMQTYYPASAECIELCELIEINFNTFNNYLKNDGVSLLFISSLCHKIRILESYIATQNQNLQERLLSYIHTHRDKLHKLSQKHIAQSLNVAPESLSRILKKLKNQGILTTYKGKIQLCDN